MKEEQTNTEPNKKPRSRMIRLPIPEVITSLEGDIGEVYSQVEGIGKADFITNLSHELRTPLNGIIGFTSLLMDGAYGDVQDEQMVGLSYIMSNANSLLKMVEDLLEYARLERGETSLSIIPIDINELIRTIAVGFFGAAKKKNIEISFDIDESLPDFDSDRQKLSIILKSLIGNAIKFSNEGGTVTLHTRPSKNIDGLIIEVGDTGCGIEKERWSEIFKNFHQLQNTLSREYEGLGLGLTLAYELTKILQGTLGLWSEKGEGSLFRLTFPYHPDFSTTPSEKGTSC